MSFFWQLLIDRQQSRGGTKHLFKMCPLSTQVSGHEFTRAEKMHLKLVILSGALRESCTEMAEGRVVEGSRECLEAGRIREFSRGAVPGTAFRDPVFGQVLPRVGWIFHQRNLFSGPPAFNCFPGDRPLYVILRLRALQPFQYRIPAALRSG